VSRLTVHLIVLIFTAASHATLLCNLWCGPHITVTRNCGHSGPASRLIATRNDTCDSATKGVVGVVREEVRRSGPAWDTPHASAVARYTLAVGMLDGRIRPTSSRDLSLDARPFDTNLRI
jgi:hypothetical protein